MVDERDLTNPHVRAEREQFRARPVLVAAGLLVVLALLVHFSVVGLFRGLKGQYIRTDPQPAPILTAQPRQLPPEPRLQPDPVGDLEQWRRTEEQVLTGYAWLDRSSGRVRIPIARAMQLVAERGLPAAAPAPPPTAGRK